MSLLKLVHISSAYISLTGFTIRGIWMLMESPFLTKKWVKIVPHIIDTILLTSAIALVVEIGQYPFVNNWLTAKLVALIGYIVLGTIALKRGKTKSIRIAAFIGALLVFSYILGVAMFRTPLPFT